MLLLNNIGRLPGEVPLFKISGRYYPNEHFRLIDEGLLEKFDFAGVGSDFDKRISAFSTRAYFVKNKSVLESTLVLAIEEMLSYSKGIHGIKSLFKFLSNPFFPSMGSRYQLSIEQAFARILKHSENYHLLNNINIEGYLAGSAGLEFIKE